MADQIQTQPSPTPSPAPAANDADALLDQYLEGVSPREDTPKGERPPRKQDKPVQPAEEPEETELSFDDALDSLEDAEDTDPDEEGAKEPEPEDQSPETEAGRFVAQDGRVKLADGTVTTVAELVRGNLREADYTRKTQETGALHSELQARLADYEQQSQLVSIAIDIMARALPPEPDPEMLQPGENHDPVGYTNQKLLWEHAAGQLNALVAAHQQMTQQHQSMQSTALRKYALEQRDQLLADIPELKDKAKLEAFNSDIKKTLARYGKGPDDLSQVYDAKVILMLKHLSNYWKIMGERKRARAKAQGAPVLAPSTRVSAAGKTARAKANDWKTLHDTRSHGAEGEQALDRILDSLL